MTSTFLPGIVDYGGSMARNFDVGRGLSADARAVWHAALHPHLADAPRILDVGSGTGRFAVLLAEWFGAVVVGVEPSAGMRHVATTTARHPAVFYVGGRAEQLPIRQASFTAALLSNVYHHIPNRSACALELHRVLTPGGRVLIRGAFAGRLGEITLFDHFPEAKVVCEQFPGMEEAVDTFTGSGFIFESVERVVQRTCSSLKELSHRTRLRADTTLALMTDEAFNARQAALEQAAAAETEPTPVVDTLDLVTMRKAAA